MYFRAIVWTIPGTPSPCIRKILLVLVLVLVLDFFGNGAEDEKEDDM
jgi:hypothetical protein